MQKKDLITLDVWRFNPDQDDKPYMKSYQVDPAKLNGIMLLDALEGIKVQDPSVSFRRSCGGGVCGSDGMNINGKNGLACITLLKDLPKRIVLRPLPGLPVIRDLVVDMEQFFKQYRSIKPYMITKEKPEKEFIQSEEERARIDGLYECVLCACCSSACPSYWWNPDKFAGPAALLWACRFIVDTRDQGREERMAELKGLYRLYRCRVIMNCVSVCPKSLNPTKAIMQLHEEMVRGASKQTAVEDH
jgi:succinate dehydrogenase / fumarate reductase, iron-sulfur subunit